jgi:hypothetical protein
VQFFPGFIALDNSKLSNKCGELSSAFSKVRVGLRCSKVWRGALCCTVGYLGMHLCGRWPAITNVLAAASVHSARVLACIIAAAGLGTANVMRCLALQAHGAAA